MPWYNSLNEARQKAGDVTGIRTASDLADPIGRTEDLLTSASREVLGSGGGGGGGRGQVDPKVQADGTPWDYSGDSPDQITPEDLKARNAQYLSDQRQSTRYWQGNQIQALKRAAAGEGPSAAQDQLQLATDQNMRQALAMAASGRGNAALAGQAAGRQRAQMGQQLASQSGVLRAQEMQSAQGQLSSAIEAQRQQDLIDQNRELGYAQIEAQKGMSEDQLQAAEHQAKASRQSSMFGGLMGAVGTGLAAYAAFGSDEDIKKDKSNVPDAEVDEFYKALQAKSYKYKDPHAAGQSSGEKVGMMAQDVEDTKLGEKLFSRRADGISVYDPQVLDGILLAGMKKLMKDQNYGNS